MPDYKVIANPNYVISGDTLIDAIEKKFEVIATTAGVGNAAGYTLDRVWMEKQGVDGDIALHIVAHGSDGRLGYDPRTDTPRETIVRILAKVEDCPEQHEFELNENGQEPFDPFRKTIEDNPGAIFGVAKALMDWVAEHKCSYPQVMMTSFIPPSMYQAFAPRCLLLMSNRLHALKPKSDKETQKIVERISYLTARYCEVGGKKAPDAYPIYYYKTLGYLDKSGKITALAKFRKASNMTQQEVADQVGISTRQLSRYEGKQSSLGTAKHSVVVALAEAVGAKPTDIVRNGTVVLVEE